MLELDAIYERTQADPPCVSTGATILETRDLVDALRQETKWVASLTQELMAVKAQVKELKAEQEKAWLALAKVGEYLEHSVASDDWELDADVKNLINECLEAKREIDADDWRSLDLFDA